MKWEGKPESKNVLWQRQEKDPVFGRVEKVTDVQGKVLQVIPTGLMNTCGDELWRSFYDAAAGKKLPEPSVIGKLTGSCTARVSQFFNEYSRGDFQLQNSQTIGISAVRVMPELNASAVDTPEVVPKSPPPRQGM